MRLLSVLCLLVFCGSLAASCALPYYFQAAKGQVGILRQRVPVEQVVNDGTVDAEIRERLELISQLRRFAVDEFGLPDNDSYTSYVNLGRDYVVWNVVAAEEFSVDPVTWCFPVAGCVAYRGYFDRERAERFEERLRERGYDTWSGGSPAYSTLGFFDDPVLSTMLYRSEVDIAATLFHELAHQRVYVKDDTELSESFATAVEQYGVAVWLETTRRSELLAAYRERLQRQRDFAVLVASQRQRLVELYSRDLDADAMRLAKREAYVAMRQDYEQLSIERGGDAGYDEWFSAEINNARLAAATSYQRWVPGLRSRIERIGLNAFFAEIEALIELDADQQMAALEAWNLELIR